MCDSPKRATYLYLQLTLAFSAVVWILVIWSGRLSMGFGLVSSMLMWCPALAVLVAHRLLGRELRSLAWRWPNGRYMAAAYFVPVAYTSIAYGAVWASRLAGWNSGFVNLVAQDFGLRGLPEAGSLTLYIIFMATGGVIQNLSMTVGEEIGWRGFLVPELVKQMSFTKASFLSGVLWAAWHSPLLLFADYNAGTNRWYALGCSSITCVSLSFILAWFRLKSDSLCRQRCSMPATTSLFRESSTILLAILAELCGTRLYSVWLWRARVQCLRCISGGAVPRSSNPSRKASQPKQLPLHREKS